MSEKRLVIFGCGYVGRALACAAVEAGYAVWIHSRNSESLARVDVVPASRRVVGNLQDTDWHDQLYGDWDAAINLVSSAGGGLAGYEASYIEGNRSIQAWGEKVSVRRFLYTSATSVYPQTEGEWVGEEDVPGTDELSPSGRILRQAEDEILSSNAFPERIIARLAGIYGPGRHLYLDRLREGATALPGDGAAWLNLIYLKDIVAALMALVETPMDRSTAVVNVVDDEPSQKQAIVDWLAEELGCAPISFDPELAAQRSARRTSKAGLPNRRIRNAHLKEWLGWQPQFPSFREGYRDIL